MRTQPAAFALGLALGLAAVVSAPQAGRAGGPDLVDLALGWARGDYRAPLLCEFDGEARRGLRRVLIGPGSRRSVRRVDRITFFDLEAEEASRCFSALGAEEPNLVGTLEVTLETASRPDTALRDFKATLRREGGFEFRIESGRLRRAPVGVSHEAAREIDFRGGKARLTRVEPGSDAARLLADLGGRRQLRLVLEAPDGTRLALDLAEVAPR